MNKNYRRGYEIERKAVKELKELGYNAVRTAGSHSPFDVIAWNEDQVRFIQIKRSKKYKDPSKTTIKKLMQEKTPYTASKEIWVWVDRKGFVKCPIW